MRFRSTVLLLCLVAAAACEDQRPVTAPAAQPNLVISDGAHGAGGNPDFFFLPPLVPNPVDDPDYAPGAFNARLAPTVRICSLKLIAGGYPTSASQLADAECDATIASFSGTEIKADGRSQQYSVNWQISTLDLTRFYRITVLVGTQQPVVLGYADIDPVSQKDLKNAGTGEAIPLTFPRTLPIRFRIEGGALCENRSDCASATFTDEGGTLVTNTGHGGIELPPDALPPGVPELTITMERVMGGQSCLDVNEIEMYSPLLEFEGCYKITSDPALYGTAYGSQELLKPATVGMCLALPETDAKYDFLQMHRSNAPTGVIEALQSAPATFLDCTGFTASPVTSSAMRGGWRGLALSGLRSFGSALGSLLAPRPLYAVDLGLGGKTTRMSNFGWALADTIVAVGSTSPSSTGSAPITPAVKLLGTQVHDGSPFATPVPTMPVTFTVYDDYTFTQVSSASVQTDALGIATASFSLPPGTYTIYTDAPAYGSVTFTASVGTVIP